MSSKGAAPDAPLVDLREAINDSLADWRAESIARMLSDARRAVKRWAPRNMPKADHDALAADAVCLILGWRTSGTRGADDAAGYFIECGAEGSAPMRDVWRSRDDWRHPSNAAWILMHRAILQACKAPDRIGWRPAPKEGDTRPVELPTDPVELERLREAAPTTVTELGAAHADADARTGSGAFSPIPDDVTVSDLAEACEIPVRAARAFVAKALGANGRELAAQWEMTPESAEVAISTGAKWIRDRYPDTPEGVRELAALLRDGAAKIRATRRAELVQARADLHAGRITIGAAQRAAYAYLESSRTAPRDVRALEDAALAALRRIGAEAENAPKLARLTRAATDAAKQGEYRRLAAPISAPMRGASDHVLDGRELRALEAPCTRRETPEERAARPVREVKRARKFAPYPIISRAFAAPTDARPVNDWRPVELPTIAPALPCKVCGKVHPIGYPEGLHPVRGAA